jgi:hypothetical protein
VGSPLFAFYEVGRPSRRLCHDKLTPVEDFKCELQPDDNLSTAFLSPLGFQTLSGVMRLYEMQNMLNINVSLQSVKQSRFPLSVLMYAKIF